MALSWTIDAWSPTEGIVFASMREPGSDPWAPPRPGASAPVVFHAAAPGFEAAPVDRGVAFGAVHRGFQERFSLDGEREFPFESLDELLRFVRRVYAGSGPGTLGGGEPRNPEPGPTPEGNGGAPSGPRDYILTQDGAAPHAGLLLRELNDRPTREARAGQLHGELSDRVAEASARLLLECAQAASGRGLPDFSPSPLHLAAHAIVPSVETLRASATGPVPSTGGPWFYGTPLPGWQVRAPDLTVLSEAPFPADLARAYRVPDSVRTMHDLLCFLSADREYAFHSDWNALLALLLAVAACFETHRIRLRWSDERLDGRFSERLRVACAHFIVEWLPVEPLPPALEQEVRRWCWRGPRAQRQNQSKPSSSTSGST